MCPHPQPVSGLNPASGSPAWLIDVTTRCVGSLSFTPPNKDAAIATITTTAITKYGQPSILFPEHFQSFLIMIESVDLMSRIYKDKYIKSQFRPTDISTINQILLVASGE